MTEIPFTQPHKVVLTPQEGFKEKKVQKSLFYQNATLYFCNFCENTSIHGFKFFGERHRNIFEKIYWFVVIVAAIAASGTLIYNTYTKWVTSPVVVTFAMKETPIWKIPFPAVTICSEINANPAYFNYTDVYMKYLNNESTTDEEDKYFNMYSFLCNEELEFINETETKFLSDEDYEYLVRSFEDMNLKNCKWLGDEIDCFSSLTFTATSEGWCSTFNMLSYEDIFVIDDEIYANTTVNGAKLESWSLEGGYPSHAGLNTFPYRTMISGVNGGFQIDFYVKEDDLDYLCTDLQGYKVALHHPAEIPDMDKYFRVPLNQVVVAGIRPRMITTSDEIKSYTPEARQCYVPGEKTLSLFKVYSQQNCLFECLTNFTLVECGCTPFYVPDQNVICSAGSKRCVHKAKVKFTEQEIRAKVIHRENKLTDQCGCLPACTSIEFDSETSQTDWDWRKVNKIKNISYESYAENEKIHKSRLLVYYKDLQFMTSERHELYGVLDFLANCGGLLGLCCGFSFSSLMEIIYYVTLRLYSNAKKFGWRFWSGSEELIEDEDE